MKRRSVQLLRTWKATIHVLALVGLLVVSCDPFQESREDPRRALPGTSTSLDILAHDRPRYDFARAGAAWRVQCLLGIDVSGSSTDTFSALWYALRKGEGGWVGSSGGRKITYSVGFAVTSLCFQPDGSLLVAGLRSPGGFPIIERWIFHASGDVEDESGGLSHLVGKVQSKALVFDSSSLPDFPLIRGMATGGALGADEALLLTTPRASIYRFDAESGTVKLELDQSRRVADLPRQPLLGERFQHFFYSGHHVSHGHCFVLSLTDGMGGGEGELDSLMLTDVNLDGSIDAVHELRILPDDPLQLEGSGTWIR